jgi:hypothetical protein
MRGTHRYSITPVEHDESSTGGRDKPFEKTMDKPPKQYTANESVPRDNFHSEAPPGEQENSGDFSKRFA